MVDTEVCSGTFFIDVWLFVTWWRSLPFPICGDFGVIVFIFDLRQAIKSDIQIQVKIPNKANNTLVSIIWFAIAEACACMIIEDVVVVFVEISPLYPVADIVDEYDLNSGDSVMADLGYVVYDDSFVRLGVE